MANVEGVREAIFKFMERVDPTATTVLLLQVRELGLLHYLLEQHQNWLELAKSNAEELGMFGSLREKVEAALSKAGYGGDVRMPPGGRKMTPYPGFDQPQGGKPPHK